MIYWTNFDISDIKENFNIVTERKNKKTMKIYDVSCSFDTENTSILINEDEKFAFTYIWQFGIYDENHIYYGRTIEEFYEFITMLSKELELNEGLILPVYVQNLPYDFQFIRKYFDFIDVFATEERKAIKILTSNGIQFRDSYVLSGSNLAKMAKDLTKHTIEKLVGDLDYNLIRTPVTALSDQELKYCEHDIKIILYYIDEQREIYGDITKIPMTNTGRVRKYCREKCLKTTKGKANMRYKKIMDNLKLDLQSYKMLKRAFAGGFTHASIDKVGQVINNVHSIDFTSSYPTVLVNSLMPMSTPIFFGTVTTENQDKFKNLMNNNKIGLLFDITFYDIESKFINESYIQKSKCSEIINPTINNGRVFMADKLTTTITDIDFRIIKQVYKYSKIQVDNVYYFHMDYLPKKFVECILDLYEDKTTLKDVQGMEQEYQLKKGMLNALYGMCIMAIDREIAEYINGEWTSRKQTDSELQDEIEKVNNSFNRFIYYPWGVWCTAYARANLWSGILNIGDDYIYSDTDSIKFTNLEKHQNYIDFYNKNVEMKLQQMCDTLKINFEKVAPKTIEGKTKMLGVWDYEGKSNKFKTLGAKRYLTMKENNGEKEYKITIAGLGKKDGRDYIVKKNNHDDKKIFDFFNDEMYIPGSDTGKNTHTYIDYEIESIVTDYQGNTTTVKQKSGVHLSACDFSLSISDEYSNFIKEYNNGYLLTKYDI